ncbi:MAG: DNA-3-methyladenine glycosylase I [Rubricoccaceae bacterium]|nr:DNA-3-methyladenine glycosylase I [Rubricoccaceae bacterium]
MLHRCSWVSDDPLDVRYHDSEWGVPVHDDRTLFEFITLEGAQAGLSWVTILRKRDGYREVFSGFDPSIVATYDEEKVEDLLQNSGIVRHRQKIESTISNAKVVLDVQERYGSLSYFLWDIVGGKPRVNAWKSVREAPTETDLSRKMSRVLKQHGFRFMGPTTCYAFMQAVGMVNDHTVDCFRYHQINASND